MSQDKLKKYYAGIDVGSLSTDGVVIDGSGEVIHSVILPTGASILKTIANCREEMLSVSGGGEIKPEIFVSTGYGRKRVDFSGFVLTEITAHALGSLHFFPETRTVIDIGGQDTKVIRVGDAGDVLDFAMNDKCAAGTGRFLEVMARLLETDLEGMAEMALRAEEPASITSTCTVFIESEIISLISESREVESIAAGVFHSIAGRIASMVRSLGGVPPFTVTGGVAKNRAMIFALKNNLSEDLQTPPEPQIMGALGAALFGLRKA